MSSLTFATLFAQAPVPSADEIVDRVDKVDLEASSRLKSYSSIRRYVISTPRSTKPSEMTVRMTYAPDQGKNFEIVSMQNVEGIQRRILQKILDGERDASRKKTSEDIRISPRNYHVGMLGTEQKHGTLCYVLAMKPKRKSKFLLEGKAWVNAQDYGMIAIEGRPSDRISFWVGRPDVVQTFEKVGPVWMMSTNRSIADVKFIGRSTLAILSSDIQVKFAGTDQIARSVPVKHVTGAVENASTALPGPAPVLTVPVVRK